MPESECSLVKEIALYSCSRNQTMVFCCIAAWIQPDQTDCLQDFLLSETETCWEPFEDFFENAFECFSRFSEGKLRKTSKAFEKKASKYSKEFHF